MIWTQFNPREIISFLFEIQSLLVPLGGIAFGDILRKVLDKANSTEPIKECIEVHILFKGITRS